MYFVSDLVELGCYADSLDCIISLIFTISIHFPDISNMYDSIKCMPNKLLY